VKHILLGITGSIAAFKSIELLRLLKKSDYEVRVVLTTGAQEFVTALTLQTLSGEKVYTQLLDAEAEYQMDHIRLARWADMILVAPASANFLSRLAHGMADDLLTTLCLATAAPIVVAPAMNRQMWCAEVTQDNRRLLQQRHVLLWGPDNGIQACGEEGLGRMLEAEEIKSRVDRFLTPGVLDKVTVMITAGPTIEDIDPVRFISNRSSGKMGYALAVACRNAGARVILVSGPVHLSPPEGVTVVSVRSADNMQKMVEQHLEGCQLFIATAAVADYQPIHVHEQKIKKAGDNLSLELKPTPDILKNLSNRENPPFLVGFAAETQNLLANAEKKRLAKRLDMIVANEVSEGKGFDQEENTVTVCWQGECQCFDTAPKKHLAVQLIDLIATRFNMNINRK
jgi:phosphopantothenoylcysteine decarboxylase / phosphopantothenate---cysteine ligase